MATLGRHVVVVGSRGRWGLVVVGSRRRWVSSSLDVGQRLAGELR